MLYGTFVIAHANAVFVAPVQDKNRIVPKVKNTGTLGLVIQGTVGWSLGVDLNKSPYEEQHSLLFMVIEQDPIHSHVDLQL